MTFDSFLISLRNLVNEYEKQIPIKIEIDEENQIIKIFGQEMSSLGRAKGGLNDTMELALTTAEHHPYWGILYNCCQIIELVLERWNSKISAQELEDISWSLKEIKEIASKISEKNKVIDKYSERFTKSCQFD